MGPLTALDAAQASGLLPPGARLLVACSGGRDSMALCHALQRAERWPLHVATVNHGLRAGAESDAAFVVETMRDWGLDCAVERPEVGRVGAQGPEDAARRARHAALETARARVGAELIVLAHTADDQWETLTMRLAEGAGLAGLAGMRLRSGRRVRPWLGVTRGQVAAYAAAEGVPWREDPTNIDPRFLRNRVRHVLRPAAEAVFGTGLVVAAARTADTLATQAAALDELLSAQRDRWLMDAKTDADGGVTFTLDAAALRAATGAMRRVVVHHLIIELHARAGVDVPRSLSARVDRVCAALEVGAGRGVGGRDGFTMTQRRGAATWRLVSPANRPV